MSINPCIRSKHSGLMSAISVVSSSILYTRISVMYLLKSPPPNLMDLFSVFVMSCVKAWSGCFVNTRVRVEVTIVQHGKVFVVFIEFCNC